MRLALAAVLALALALPALAVEPPLLWLPGDAWTWALTGSVEGERSATAARDGSGWRTAEVERTHPPGAPLNTSETRITRTWAAPLRLASEERVSRHCVEVPLTGAACGNLTERWSYDPPLDLVRFPLAVGQAWQQAVHVVHAVQDEVGVNQSIPSDEMRYFAVVQTRTVDVAAGALPGWDILVDTEGSDVDGAYQVLTYGDAAQHLLAWSEQQGPGSQRGYALSSLALQPRTTPPGPTPPPPPPSPPSPPASSGNTSRTGPSPPSGAGDAGPAASGGGPAGPGATTPPPPAPAASPPSPAAPPGAKASDGPVGPPRERDLRGTPGLPVLAVLGALLLAARRRST